MQLRIGLILQMIDPNQVQRCPIFQIPPVHSYQYKGDIDSLYNYVMNLEYREKTDNTKSQRTDLLEHKELFDLKKFCSECIQHYSLEVCGSRKEIDIQQSWSNLAYKNDMHNEHFHANSYLSGVFYLRNDTTPIMFHADGLIEKYFFSVRPEIAPDVQVEIDQGKRYLPSIGGIMAVAAKPGTLLVFSSRSTHSVPPNMSDNPRLSIAFNTFPKLPFGDYRALTYIE